MIDVYPENRIVIDYGGMADLILLGAVHVPSGRTVPPAQVNWPDPVVEGFPFATFGEALAAPARPNREGLVVHVPSTGERVKLKYEECCNASPMSSRRRSRSARTRVAEPGLHKIVTGLSSRTIWEALVAGDTVAPICEQLPDEFHAWAQEVAARLHADVEYLFARLDGKNLRPALWQQIKPEAGETLTALPAAHRLHSWRHRLHSWPLGASASRAASASPASVPRQWENVR